MSETFIATDGACTGNGQKDAKAGYGVFVNAEKLAYGPVPPNNIILGPRLNGSGLCMTKGPDAVTPTNNRGELLAIIVALLAIHENLINGSPSGKKYVILSDSEYCINIMTTWLASWVKYNKIKSRKNPDLLHNLHVLQTNLREKRVSIRYQHQKAHKKDKIGAIRTHLEELNYQADRLAVRGIEAPRGVFQF
ncbi:hypothetical protein KDA11_06100 [Candidatus Saccharibacteria bacterium]|nr:hypothetical protein [Candidatus Saccharibacteria bacterium]